MVLFEFHIHNNVDLEEVNKKLDHIHQLIHKIMADFAQIKEAFDSLQAAVTEERQQISAKLDELQTTINDLNTNLQQGGTAEERDELLGKIQTLTTEVKAIIPDAPEQQPGE